MRNLLLAAVAVAVLCGACFLSYPMLQSYATIEIGPPLMEANVIVKVPGGKGSGVHIGNGYVLTAAHVVGKEKTVTLGYYKGGEQKAEVLWSNPDYDLALIHVDRKTWDAVAPLNCAPNYLGQKVRVVGNPGDLDFVYTAGTISGGPIKQGNRTTYPIDGVIVFGQSGGGVLDEKGNTVGIAVAVMGTPYGIAAIGYFVPAQTACMLMGRA